MPGHDHALPDRSRSWVTAAALLAMVTSSVLLFLPVVATADDASGTDAQSLVQQQGWATAAVLAVPVLISAAPLLVRGRHRRTATIGSAVLLTAGALVSIASVGLFYLPSAALLVVAAIRSGRSVSSSGSVGRAARWSRR